MIIYHVDTNQHFSSILWGDISHLWAEMCILCEQTKMLCSNMSILLAQLEFC